MKDRIENKALAKRWLDELWTKGNYNAARDILAADYMRHDPFNKINNPEEYCEFIRMFRMAFPDIEYTADDMIAERDYVLIRWTARGSNTGPLMILPATGKRIELNGLDLLRIENGKVVESWPGYDGLSLLRLLGHFNV